MSPVVVASVLHVVAIGKFADNSQKLSHDAAPQRPMELLPVGYDSRAGWRASLG
jgi:hypothetical protein